MLRHYRSPVQDILTVCKKKKITFKLSFIFLFNTCNNSLSIFSLCVLIFYVCFVKLILYLHTTINSKKNCSTHIMNAITEVKRAHSKENGTKETKKKKTKNKKLHCRKISINNTKNIGLVNKFI